MRYRKKTVTRHDAPIPEPVFPVSADAGTLARRAVLQLQQQPGTRHLPLPGNLAMMAGYFAALAAQTLAETEARLQVEQEEQARRAAEAQRQFDLLRNQHEALHGVVIDVEAREVPDVLPLPAP
jgi:hypothetical protein